MHLAESASTTAWDRWLAADAVRLDNGKIGMLAVSTTLPSNPTTPGTQRVRGLRFSASPLAIETDAEVYPGTDQDDIYDMSPIPGTNKALFSSGAFLAHFFAVADFSTTPVTAGTAFYPLTGGNPGYSDNSVVCGLTSTRGAGFVADGHTGFQGTWWTNGIRILSISGTTVTETAYVSFPEWESGGLNQSPTGPAYYINQAVRISSTRLLVSARRGTGAVGGFTLAGYFLIDVTSDTTASIVASYTAATIYGHDWIDTEPLADGTRFIYGYEQPAPVGGSAYAPNIQIPVAADGTVNLAGRRPLLFPENLNQSGSVHAQPESNPRQYLSLTSSNFTVLNWDHPYAFDATTSPVSWVDAPYLGTALSWVWSAGYGGRLLRIAGVTDEFIWAGGEPNSGTGLFRFKLDPLPSNTTITQPFAQGGTIRTITRGMSSQYNSAKSWTGFGASVSGMFDVNWCSGGASAHCETDVISHANANEAIPFGAAIVFRVKKTSQIGVLGSTFTSDDWTDCLVELLESGPTIRRYMLRFNLQPWPLNNSQAYVRRDFFYQHFSAEVILRPYVASDWPSPSPARTSPGGWSVG